jgi:hypothetical protein
LENGYIWIGQANLNPQTNPVVTYYDEALTIVAPQPLRTLNGYISRAGTPAQVYVDGVNFSILVQDSKGSMVYNFPEGTGVSPNAAGVEYDPPFTGAVTSGYTVQDKLSQYVSVKDFGAVGDGVTNDASAIQDALDYVGVLGGAVFLPTGVYNIGTASPAITIPGKVRLVGEQSSYRPDNSQAVELLYGGTGTAVAAGGMFIECSNIAIRATSPSGTNLIGLLHDGGWFGTYTRLTFRNFPTANGYAFKMTSGPVAYGSYACCLDQIDAQSSTLAFFGRAANDGITTLTLKDVHGERMTASNAQIVVLNGSFTVDSGTAVFLGPEAYLIMLGVDIEGSGDYGILVDSATASLSEIGTIWAGWSGTRRVFNNGGTIEGRSYGPVSVQQTLVANTAIKVSEFGGQAVSNGVLRGFVSEYLVPANLGGGNQDAYRQWQRYNNGTDIVDHNWQQHAFVQKAISTSATSAATIFTVPVPNGTGLKLSAHAQGQQIGDNVYSNSRGCNVINNGGTLTIVQDTQVTCGSAGAIAFVASGSNVLVQWTPSTANASTGTMNLEIRGPWTSYS